MGRCFGCAARRLNVPAMSVVNDVPACAACAVKGERQSMRQRPATREERLRVLMRAAIGLGCPCWVYLEEASEADWRGVCRWVERETERPGKVEDVIADLRAWLFLFDEVFP